VSSPSDGSDPVPPSDPVTPSQAPAHTYNPYDPHPYGHPGGPGGPGGPGEQSTDGISIAALVCSLTCCAAPVGIGLGIAGIVRTGDGRRPGRWAAVTGLVLGIVGTLLAIGGGVGLVWYGTSTVFIEDARVGDCLEVGEVDLWQRDCDEPHDAEVVHAGRFDEALVAGYVDAAYSYDFCAPLAIRSGYSDVVRGGNHDLAAWVDSWDVDAPEAGDHFMCVAESFDGTPLDGRLPRGGTVGSNVDGRISSTYDLGVGDCFDEPGDALHDELVGTILEIDCAEEHELQYIGQVQVYGADWPGDAALEKRVDACLDRFRTYVGIDHDDSRYELGYYVPSRGSWADGDRVIKCLASSPTGEKLTGTLKGIAK
jgi:hypothetical protein